MKVQTKVNEKTNMVAPEIKDEITADVLDRQDIAGVKMTEKDIKEMLMWMKNRINAKNAKKQKNYEPIKNELIEDILAQVNPGQYFFRNRDLGYLTQYAENALADNEKFYKTVQAVFRRAN